MLENARRRSREQIDLNYRSFRRTVIGILACISISCAALLIFCRIFITMSRRSSAAATKRRHVNDAKPPAPKSDWLSVFAAASMFIGDDVMEGSLFPMTSSSGRSTSTCSAQTGTSNSAAAAHHSHEEEYTAKDFGPITFHDQLIDRLYAALQEEQLKKNDPSLASVYIYSANPTPFKKYLRFCGYGAVANGKHNAGVFVKRANFHLVPDPKTVAIVSRTLMGVGYRYKANKSLRGQWPIASSVMQCPLPAEGTHWLDVFAAVAMYIDNSVMRGGLFAKPGAKSQSADDFDRIVIYSRSRFFRAAHHLYSAIKREQSTRRDPALTSIRIFCPNPETFVAQLGRFGYRRVDGGGSMTTKNENENEVQEEQPEVYAKDPAITPPKLITIEDDGQYPSLPLSASNATGTSFVPWVDVTEAPASDVPEERGTMDVEEGLNIPEWYKNVEEYHNGNNLLPIGAKNGALVPSGEDGDDHLSVMTTFSPISAAIAMAEDDLSSCPSINCDGQDDALIPFIDYS